MYSLHFAFALQHPRSMDEMEWRMQQARPFYRRRGESSPAYVVCVCGMRAACGGSSGLALGSATHFHSVAIATQPVHRLQIRTMVHNYRGIPYHYPKLHPGPCNSVGMRPRTDTQTDTQTLVTTIHFSSSTTHAKCNNACLTALMYRSLVCQRDIQTDRHNYYRCSSINKLQNGVIL